MKTKYQIQHIVVPVDFSESSIEALKESLSLASTFQASVHLVHVMNVSSQVFPWSTENIDYDKIKATVRAKFDELISKHNTSNVEVTSEIRQGSVAKEILAIAKDSDASLILMSTHGSSGLEEFFIGSYASKIVTSSTVPVLTLRPNTKELGFNSIAMPIDSTVHTRDKVAQVTTLAQKFNSTVHIASLITDEHEDEINQFRLKVKQLEEHFTLNNVSFTTDELRGDDITEMTLGFADDKHADLIAIMTDQEASTGLFVGPHAQRIVNHSKRPVLSVTPIGVLEFNEHQGMLQGSSNPFN